MCCLGPSISAFLFGTLSKTMQRTQLVIRALQLASTQQPCEQWLASLSRTCSQMKSAEHLLLTVRPSSGVSAASRWMASQPGISATRAAVQNQARFGVQARLYSAEAGTQAEGDTMGARFVRFFALFMMVAAGFKVAPWVAASSVGNTLGLLDAQEPFLLKSGISRLLIVVRASEAGQARAVEGGAVAKLLRLVSHEDEAVVDGALMALETLAASEAGLEALRSAGGQEVLLNYLARMSKGEHNKDPIYRAQQLLLDLQRPQTSSEAVSRQLGSS